jgi:hypothetical protein
VDATGLAFPVASGNTYSFAFDVLWKTAAVTNGIKLGLTFPSAVIVTATATIPVAADGTASDLKGWITSSGDSVIGTGAQATGTTYLATIEGTIRPSANGTLQVQYAGELSTTQGVTIQQESVGIMVTVP